VGCHSSAGRYAGPGLARHERPDATPTPATTATRTCADSGIPFNYGSAVTEPSVLYCTKAAYDAIAHLYAELFGNVLETLPMERAMLAAFTELVRAHNSGPVADIGCGPGHVTAHLHALGQATFGIDLSSEMIALARRAHPDLQFDEGSMTALDLADGVLGGILAFYSVIHTPPRHLPAVFTEFQRVLAPGGHLLLGFFAGEDPLPQEFDHKVTLAYRWSPDSLVKLLRQAGFAEVSRMLREPYENERQFRHATLLVRKPQEH
jgi:SAM-dependent methyltransferase